MGPAIWGIPGYTFKGIYKELQKHLGSSVQSYIVAARTAQGYEEWHNSNRQERLDVVSRWQAIQVEIEKEKHHMSRGSFYERPCYLKSTIKEKKRLSAEKKQNKKRAQSKDGPDSPAAIPKSHPFVQQQSGGTGAHSADFEEAIHASVAATSRGNPDEDKMIEKAIRASVLELQSASEEGDDADAIQRAIQASVAEAAKLRGENSSKPHTDGLDGASDHDRELEAALHRSVSQPPSASEINLANVDFDDSGVDTDDDENITAAIERSQSAKMDGPKAANLTDEDFEKAVELSKKAQEEHEQGLSKLKTEEEIVLEYVKRQSLAEEQHKRSIISQQSASHDPSDQEMKKAMENSLNLEDR